ncbi:MAG: OprD family outer membrane porin [Nibricoccus sp.]
MSTHIRANKPIRTALTLLAAAGSSAGVFAQQPAPATDTATVDLHANDPKSSAEQGQTHISETYELEGRAWRVKTRKEALQATTFKINPRFFYLDRNKYDGSESESMAIGGWAGLKTGYFLEHVSFGATGYTSQKLMGDDDKDGALLLGPGQESYSVLGELYADIKIVEDLNVYAGRKEFDTPYLNRNDSRMTPNTFEAIALQGRVKSGDEKDKSTFKYGFGYFDKIKERNSDDFVSMSKDAGATVERGVYVLGGNYQKGALTIGAIDYYSEDIINIAYVEAKFELKIGDSLKPKIGVQFTDQKSVGDELLKGSFGGQAYGVKGDLPFGPAMFTAGYTYTTGTNMQNPWSGYPGYTSVQVEDFNRDGEGAILVRASYECSRIEGLSAYALLVHGMEPDAVGQFARTEYDFNIQWAPPKDRLKGLSVRLRYAIVDEDNSKSDTLTDLRAIVNYVLQF